MAGATVSRGVVPLAASAPHRVERVRWWLLMLAATLLGLTPAVGVAEAAAQFAVENLVKGGTFVAKVFQGGAQGALLEQLKANFDDVRHWKPPSSRSESPETFVIARGFRG